MVRKLGPYERFSEADLILRDELALDRTVLANERTLLAYVRTALAFAVTGVGVIRFLDGTLVGFVGSAAVVCAVGIAVFGLWRYRRVARRIAISRDPARPPTAASSD